MKNSGFAAVLHSGWYLAAVTTELTDPITPLAIGDRRMMIVRPADERPRVYRSVCPHRGANLAYGGTLARAGVICPFHGKAIALGGRDDDRLAVAELPSFVAGPALFVALDPDVLDDNGFRDEISSLAGTHQLFPCPAAQMPISQELVIENAFDLDHFIQVHRIPRVTAMQYGRTASGAAFCEARFRVRMPAWDGGGDAVVENRFHATAFSPSIVMSQLGDPASGQTVITAVAPTEGGCSIRVINAVRPGAGGVVPEQAIAALTDGARKALEQDRPVWTHLDPDMEPRFDPRDEAVLLFRQFCGEFLDLGPARVLC
jgi:3-ketosteroid 9alpha-monooxygenase subunit A